MKYAPIVLFVYNRPWHTRQTLEALKSNTLSNFSKLYIYADGIKESSSEDDIRKVKEVRKLIREKKWCQDVSIIESDENLGLAKSIIDGVTTIVNKYGKVIVLEDDIITSIGFLKYMNEALELYADENKVMHISGYIFPVKGKLPQTFFYKQASCWGWGTWKRAWQNFQHDPQKILINLNQLGYQKIEEADIDKTNQFIQQLENNVSAVTKTWAVNWHFSIFLSGGLCLHPGKSLVKNIGHDGSGIHCVSTNRFDTILTPFVKVQKRAIRDNKKIYILLAKYYKNKNHSLLHRLKEILAFFYSLSAKKLLELIFKNKTTNNIENTLLRYVPADIKFLERPLKIVDIASFRFMKKELFDNEIYKFNTTNQHPYIIDAGANIGLSIIYFKKLYPNAEIIAFEPDENIFDVLTFNINSFNFKNVTLIKKAIWDSNSVIKFLTEGADAGRIIDNCIQNDILEVSSVSLRDYLYRKVDLLKLDIEGAEAIVLNNCRDLLFNVERIFVEYHSFSEADQSLSLILEILKEAGFRYHIQSSGAVSNHPFLHLNKYNGMDLQLNIFAFRK